MKQNKQSRLVAILALCVSVVGLTLGFAAFSNTLTISSSATVKPDQKEFLLKVYGSENEEFFDFSVPESYTSDSISKGLIIRNGNEFIGVESTSIAKIESSFNANGSNQIVISDVHATMKSPGDLVEYWFMIKNEGKYDAYLTASELDKYINIKDSTTCTPVIKDGEQSATESLVTEACKGMNIFISVDNLEHQSLSPGGSSVDYIKLDKYVDENDFGYAYIYMYLEYEENSARADGEFTVDFADIELEFTTVPPTA